MEPLIDLELPVSLGVAWAHLREPELIARWFGWDHDGLEREIAIVFHEEASVDLRGHLLTWRDGVQAGDRLGVTGDDHTSRLQLWRAAREAPAAFDAIDEGWITFTQQLRFALARHPGEDRRTVRRAVAVAGPPAPRPGDEPWFATERQRGVVRDGVLVITAVAPAGAARTVSAYGAAAPRAEAVLAEQ